MRCLVCLPVVLFAAFLLIVIEEVPKVIEDLDQRRYSRLVGTCVDILQTLFEEEYAAEKFLSEVAEGVVDTELIAVFDTVHDRTLKNIAALSFEYRSIFPIREEESQSPVDVLTETDAAQLRDAVLKRIISPTEISQIFTLLRRKSVHLIALISTRSALPLHAMWFGEITHAIAAFADITWRHSLRGLVDTMNISEYAFAVSMEAHRDVMRSRSLLLGAVGNARQQVLISELFESMDAAQSYLFDATTFNQWSVLGSLPAGPETAEMAYFLGSLRKSMLTTEVNVSDLILVSVSALGALLSAALSLFLIFFDMSRFETTTQKTQVNVEEEISSKALQRIETLSITISQCKPPPDLGDVKGLTPLERDAGTCCMPARELSKRILALHRTNQLTTFATRNVTLLLIDCSQLQALRSLERLATVAQEIYRIADLTRGIVYEISGSRVILAWNLFASATAAPGESACSALFAIEQACSSQLAPLFFSITSGKITGGVSGSATLQVFSAIGEPLFMGSFMLGISKAINCAVVDEATRVQLSSFFTRPIEYVSMGPQRGFVVSELHRAAPEGDEAPWLTAFDAYRLGDVERARDLFLALEDGSRSSVNILATLSQAPFRFLSVLEDPLPM